MLCFRPTKDPVFSADLRDLLLQSHQRTCQHCNTKLMAPFPVTVWQLKTGPRQAP